jgi:uncharacterized OB-fold protein
MASCPIAPGLFTADPEPCLIGGRHRTSGRIVFPVPAQAAEYETYELPRHGHLWSYTIQRFAPKSPPYAGPEPFTPFAVGYVELDRVIIVESRLVDVSFDAIRIGMPLELTVVPFRTDADGSTITTFAFRPADEARR